MKRSISLFIMAAVLSAGCTPSGNDEAESYAISSVTASLSGTVWAENAELTLFNSDGRKVSAPMASGALTGEAVFSCQGLDIPSGTPVYAAYPAANSFLDGKASVTVPVIQKNANPHYLGLSEAVTSEEGLTVRLSAFEAQVSLNVDLGGEYPDDTVSAVSVTTAGALIAGSFAVDFASLQSQAVTAKNGIDLQVEKSAGGCSARICVAPSDWTAVDSCIVTVTTQNNIFRIFKRPASAFAASGVYELDIDLASLTKAETLCENGYTAEFIGKKPETDEDDDDDDDEPGTYPAETGALSSYTNLSSGGRANCYMVGAAGNFKFDAGSAGNGVISVAGNPVFGAGSATLSFDSVGILWTDMESCPISDVKADGRFIGFTVKSPFTLGNVVIGASLNGTVVWSWHIWLTPTPALYPLNGYSIMDRNLGSRSSSRDDEMDCWGLLYQWGRKDPFLSGNGVDNTSAKLPYDAAGNQISFSFLAGTASLAAAPADPMAIYKGEDIDWLEPQNDYLWGGSAEGSANKDTPKTVNDPCPPGYKVPQIKTWSGMKVSQAALYDPNKLGNTKGGVMFSVGGYDFWFTFEGYLDINVAEGTYPLNWSTKQSRLWTSAPASDRKCYAMHLMRSGAHEDQKVLSRMQGFCVRCIVDEYEY